MLTVCSVKRVTTNAPYTTVPDDIPRCTCILDAPCGCSCSTFYPMCSVVGLTIVLPLPLYLEVIGTILANWSIGREYYVSAWPWGRVNPTSQRVCISSKGAPLPLLRSATPAKVRFTALYLRENGVLESGIEHVILGTSFVKEKIQ